MRNSSLFFVTGILVLLLLTFYFGSELCSPWLYSSEEWTACHCPRGEDFCYRLPENNSVMGERFNCNYERILEELGLSSESSGLNLEAENIPTPVIVTAFSDSHYNRGLKLISSVRGHMPNQTVVVYDLGLHRVRVATLKSLCNVKYRRFSFEKYPGYVKHLHEYRWKPILIAEALRDFGAIWYMDSSVRLKRNSLNHVHDLLRCRKKAREIANGGESVAVSRRAHTSNCSKLGYLMHSFAGHGIYAATHPGTS
ncbi:hypothetical protein L596_004112 [Steinernema carpocapsae]|uniref:Uncharacterized protein n=1 Tax=Steinernema carpocapsae TaxID=34508 RepID=A0A4U8UUW8_STECR|nr:hypothetical protein L596_004112 [Steinernema carpocapsae]